MVIDMPGETQTKRFIYPTQGVCPPEIHFKVTHGRLEDVRFVGGGARVTRSWSRVF